MTQTVISVLVVLGLVSGACLLVWWLGRRGRTQRLRETVRFAGLGGGPRAKQGFVGRTTEIKAFADILTKWGKQDSDALRLLVITGDAGIGKHALLAQFRDQCVDSRTARAGPLFELDRDTGGPEKVMRELANGLERLERDSAAQFYARRERLEDQRHERASPLESAVQAGQGAATTLEKIGLPGAKPVAAVATSGFVGQAVSQLELPVDVDGLTRALVDDIRHFAKQRPDAPLAIFLADLDARPGDLGAAWLRDTLLPTLSDVPVLVVASVRSPSTEDHIKQRLTPAESRRLGPLNDEDVRRYAREVIALKEADAIDQVADRIRPGSPKRLEALRRQIQNRPDLLEAKALPEWVFTEANAEAAERLGNAEHPMDRPVLEAAALLRWFNTGLLEDVATAAGVQSAASPLDIAGIITRARAAPTVEPGERGWTVSEDRRAIAEELRRLSPEVWRAVHLAAARRHHRQLTGAGRAPALAEMLSWTPPDDLEERVRDREWLDALLERQYHLLALRPHEAARSLCDIAATMLYASADDAARRMLAFEIEPESLGRNRVYLALMHRAAWALSDGRVTDAATALRDLAATGGPTPLVIAAVRYRLGILHQLTGDYGDALTTLQIALDLVADRSFPLWRRLAATTAAWIGWVEAASGGSAGNAIRRFDEASETAAPLRDLDLTTWIEHLRAKTQETFADPAEARATYDQVLAAYERLADPRGIAGVRLARALVLKRLNDDDGAKDDVDTAESIIQELGDDAQRAEVELVRTLMALAGDDLESAQQHSEMASRLRPTDHSLLDQLGRCFYRAGFAEQARRFHEAAIKLATAGRPPDDGAEDAAAERGPAVNDVAVYHTDLAYALMELGDIESAATEFDRAAKLGPDNLEPLRALLRIQGADREAATATAERLSALIKRRALARARQGPQPGLRLPDDLLGALDEATPWLPIEPRTALLEALIEAMPADPRLRHRHFEVLASQPRAEQSANPRVVLQEAVAQLTDDDPPKLRHEYLVDLAERLVREHDWQEAGRAIQRAAETGVTSPRWSKVSLRVDRLARWEQTSFAAVGAADWVPRIRVDVSDDLSDWFNPSGDSPQAQGARRLFETMLPELRKEVQRRTGVRLPGVNFRAASDLAPRSLRIAIDHVARTTLKLVRDELTELPPDEVRSRTGEDAIAAECPWNGRAASWISSTTADALRKHDIDTWDPRGVACAMLLHAIGDGELARLLDVQQAADLLGDSADADACRRATLVLRQLVADGVPLRDADAVRELILDAQPGEAPHDIAERARSRLIGAALAEWADDHEGSLRIVELSADAEARIADGTRYRRERNTTVIAMDGATRGALLNALLGVDTGLHAIVGVSAPETRVVLSAVIRAEQLPLRAVELSELDGMEWQRAAVLELTAARDPVEARPHA